MYCGLITGPIGCGSSHNRVVFLGVGVTCAHKLWNDVLIFYLSDYYTIVFDTTFFFDIWFNRLLTLKWEQI